MNNPQDQVTPLSPEELMILAKYRALKADPEEPMNRHKLELMDHFIRTGNLPYELNTSNQDKFMNNAWLLFGSLIATKVIDAPDIGLNTNDLQEAADLLDNISYLVLQCAAALETVYALGGE